MFGTTNALRHPHLVVFPELRNAFLKCICDESRRLRYERMANIDRTNLAISDASSSRPGCPPRISSAALASILAGVRALSGRGVGLGRYRHDSGWGTPGIHGVLKHMRIYSTISRASQLVAVVGAIRGDGPPEDAGSFW